MRRVRYLAITLLAFLLVAAGLAVAPSGAAAAPDGYTSVDTARISPDMSGDYRVDVHAVAEFVPSVDVVGAPDPTIYWGDGTSDPMRPQSDACDALAPSCLWDGYNLSGLHFYTKAGTYHITMRYYTGFAIWYDATWDVTIPRSTDTIDISLVGRGFGMVTYAPAALDGGTACPPDCAPQWLAGTAVTFTAVAKVGSAFDKYADVRCGPRLGRQCPSPCQANPCTWTMPQHAGYENVLNASFFRTDVTAPVITASATTADGNPYTADTWTNQAVTVAFSCADVGAGASGVETNTVAPNAVTPATISTEGANQSVKSTGTCVDNAANAAVGATFGPIKIDMTAPTVTYTGNAGTYTVDQTVAITCTPGDTLSGVAASTCRDITGPAYSFALGTNAFSATATDNAGNTMATPARMSFTVTVNAAAIDAVIGRLVTNPDVAASLQQQVDAIAAAPNANAKAGKLNAFIHAVNAQTGKSITPANAALLIALAKAL